MIDAAAPDVTDHPAAWARPLHERKIAGLGELAEQGLQLARTITDQVKTENADPQAAAVAFAQVARAVRLTFMLQDKLIKDLLAYDHNRASRASSAARMVASKREDLADERKAKVERIVERVVDAEAADPEEAERLIDEMGDRLDHDDIYGAVLSKPVSELVAMICKDLGVSPDWPLLAEEAWALEEMAGNDVGWPLRDPALERFNHEDHEEDHEGHKESAVFVTFVPPS